MKINPSAELGNGKCNDGSTVNVVFHDISNMTQDVEQALQTGRPVGTVAPSHHVDLLAELRQLGLLHCSGTKKV